MQPKVDPLNLELNLTNLMSSNEHLSLEAPNTKIKTKRKGLFNNKLEHSYRINQNMSDSDKFLLIWNRFPAFCCSVLFAWS